MLAALISLAVVVILLVVLYVRDRSKRASPDEVQISLNPQKFDTTLGDFHDMRRHFAPWNTFGPPPAATPTHRHRRVAPAS